MTPDRFLRSMIDPGLLGLRLLGGPPNSDAAARTFLLAVAQQESGAALEARYQSSPSSTPGPARGFWQFEQGGGVHGVMQHAVSQSLAMSVCASLTVQWNEPAVWRALEGHDVLAVAFARLLLWTDPYPIPTTQDAAWTCYAERLWRPGAPHPEVWPGNWQRAVATVEVAAGN